MSDRGKARVGSSLSAAALFATAAIFAVREASAQSCAPGSFSGALVRAVTYEPRDVAIADFDRDGRLDVAVSLRAQSPTPDRLSVLWGDGVGGFDATPTTVLLGVDDDPRALTVGDFDGDGAPDLAVALRGINRVRPVLKTAGRSFALGTPFQPLQTETDRVVAADVDRDGTLDLVSSGASGGFTFSRNDGSGAFSNATGAAAAGPLAGLAVADFNRDGHPDVALARQGAPGEIALYRNDGSAGWPGEQAFPLPSSGGRPTALAASDVNRDGASDLVVGTDGTQVVALLGNGAADFPTLKESPVQDPQTDLTLADFDRDGRVDVAVAQPTTRFIRIVFGRDDGTFAPAVPVAAEQQELFLAAADFDEDGRVDLAGAAAVPTNAATLRRNLFGIACQSASLARAGRLHPLPNRATAIASADWNGDGIPDAATAQNLSVSVLTSDGKLGFSSASLTLPASGNPKGIAVADFDQDGDPDLAVTTQVTSVLLFRNTAGTLASIASLALPTTAYAPVAGDWNGDGAPDVVTINRLDTSLSFFRGAGDLTFAAPLTTPIGFGAMSAVAAADVDGDSRLDVVVTSDANDTVRWYKGDGAGGFSLGGVGDMAVGDFPSSVAAADLNGDGKPDLAVANGLGDSVSVRLGLGGGSFGAALTFPVGDSPRSISVRDANGDGNPDIVVANTDSNDVTVLLGDGAGGFPSARRTPGHNIPEAALLMDADRNGTLDLVVTSSPSTTGGNVAVFPGDGLGGFGPHQLPGGDSADLATGDFDRDGRTDIVALHDGSSNLAYYRGNGDGSFAAPASFPVGFPAGAPNNLGVGDFDRDGDLDVFVTNSGSAVALMLGNGLGGFVAQPWIQIVGAFSTSSGHGLVVGDFDRDGALDIAKADINDNSVTVLFGDGAGGFHPAQVTLSVGAGYWPTGIATLDYNKDGILDLAVSIFSHNLVVLLTGSGSRAAPFFVSSSLPTGALSAPLGVTSGDFDGDGNPDLAVAHLGSTPSRVGYFRGNGFGLGTQVTYGLGDPGDVDADGIAAADIDGDGKLDLLVACRGGAGKDRFSVHVLRGTGSSVPGSAFLAADAWAVAKREPSHLAVADFDGDAKPDFVVGGLTGAAADTTPVVLNSNCKPRRLRLTRQLSPCGTPGVPFASQPAVQVEDDGANPIQCDASPVAASIVAGPGGTLLGQSGLVPTNGLSDWATLPGANQLRISPGGRKFQLGFAHLLAGQTYSRTFSLSPALTISGPASYCSGAGALYTTDPGFDTYKWLVDGVGPASFLSQLTLAPGAVSAGGHNVRVDATADTCPATFNLPMSVIADLSSVAVTPPGPFSVCTSCSGASLTSAELGGGTVTRKWGYRTTAGSGPLTYISGETGSTYVLSGPDFPGQGTYYVVSESTPQCGLVTQSSNEVQVSVTDSTASPEEIPVLTARSTHQLNRLEWIYPSGHATVAIRYSNAPTWAGCAPPASVASGIADIPDQTGAAGGKGSFDHTTSLALPLQNDTTYCYSLFAETSPGVYSTLARSIKGRPFDSTVSRVKWAFSVGTSALEPPGLGSGVLHAVSNDERLYAMEKGAGGGAWPAAFRPFKLAGPSQARPVSVPIAVGPASRAIFLGSQSVIGNNSVAIDSDTGQGLWGQPLGAPVQGGPGGIFTAYGGSMDAIFFGTRDGSGTNALHARDPETGGNLAGWPYTGEATNRIGVISTQPTVDYGGNRVFFTSHRFAAGNDVAWCVDLATAARCAGWAAGVTGPLGNIEASSVLRSGRLYVSPIVATDGTLEPLDAGSGSRLWAAPFAPADGPIKLFAVADVFGSDLYLSTSTNVWAITDAGSGFSPKWSTALPQPSQPIFFAGTGRVYVGDGNGRLHVLSAATGADLVPPIELGEPGFTVAGAPTVDQAGGFVYLGSDAGVVFAVAIP